MGDRPVAHIKGDCPMIINPEELKEAVGRSLAGDENVRFFVETYFQRSSGPDVEGLLAVTPDRLLFVHRPPFAQPEVIPFNRPELEIIGKEEDMWGAKLKARAGGEPIEFKRMAPSDLKRILAELGGAETIVEGQPVPDSIMSGGTVESAGEPIAEEPPPVTSIIQTTESIQTTGRIGATPTEEPERPKVTVVPPIPQCYIHAGVESSTRCEECGRAICPICVTVFNSKSYCPRCLSKAKKKFKVQIQMKLGKSGKPSPTPKPTSKTRPGGAPVSRSPALAFLLSFIPGCGQFYNSDRLRGMFVILSFLLIYYTPEAYALREPENINFEFIRGLPFQFFLPFIIWFFSLFDAAHRANKRNAEQGVRAQSAGCFVLLLIIIVFSVIGAMAFIINNYVENKQFTKIAPPPKVGEVISPADLKAQQIKIKRVLKLYYSLQKTYYAENFQYLQGVPQKIEEANDTAYRLEAILPGARRDKYRFYAWAIIGKDNKLDLWSITDDGNIIHEMGS